MSPFIIALVVIVVLFGAALGAEIWFDREAKRTVEDWLKYFPGKCLPCAMWRHGTLDKPPPDDHWCPEQDRDGK